ncbi:hypothetical protein M0805_004277 [Coniferiporia weirii]|nr:hypothetical protein M0805_004277 [Coniferiporia weirii]
MSVASRNPFDLLSDETPGTQAPSTKAASEQPLATGTPSTRGSQKARGGPASRGGRYYQRGSGAAGSGPRDQPDQAEDSPREGKRNGEERGRGRGRGGRGRGDRGRGERGRGGYSRPFDDKHSKTGKTDTEKKVNQGWGSDEGKTELKAEEDGSKDAAAEAPTNDWGNDGAAAADAAWAAPDPAEPSGEAAQGATPAEARRDRDEEDNTLTLEQYLAQKKAIASVPQLEGRKANDGDDELFKDAVQVLKGSDDEAYFSGKPKAASKRPKKEDGKGRQYILFDGEFADRPSRGGRGGRGGDRGRDSRDGRGRGRGSRGRGRGDFYGANGSADRQVDVADQSAFPSLS